MKRSTKRLQLKIETVRSLQALDPRKLRHIVGGDVPVTTRGPGNSGKPACWDQ
jgi:hypothetical protein